MSSNSSKIAANTIVMYVRMLFLIIISFYSSRLLLACLGVNDFGIQSVVGSISSTFISIKGLFSESLQRFLNYAKGEGFAIRQREIFNLGLVIHLALAIFFVIVAEPLGCWMIGNKLEIPIERLSTAYFIFHMGILSTVISIFSIPYDAVIIANEKMKVYALITVVDACLRLGAVFSLYFLPYDKLRLYAILLLSVPLFTLLFQVFFCKRFPECRIKLCKNKKIFKEILSLSMWNFGGNMAFSLLHEGVNMMLNIFGGLVYNAARTISYHVKGVASQISTNTLIAVRPRIMQQAASLERQVLFLNILTVSRISFFSILLPVVAILAYTEDLLNFWLIKIPAHTVLFTRLILISVVVRSLHEPLNMMYMALGQIKRMTCVEIISMLLFLLIIYISLDSGMPLWTSYVEMGVMELFIILMLVINAHYEFSFPISIYFFKVILPFSILLASSGILCYLFHTFLVSNNIVCIIFYCLLVCLVYSLQVYFYLDNREKKILIEFVKLKNKIKHG